MIPEYGHFALILAFCLSLMLAGLPMVGTLTRNVFLMRSAFPLAAAIFLALSASIASLAYAFLTDDFSVAYVAANSNLELPNYYKFSALWSAHEGSLLLWIWLLSVWMFAVSVASRRLPLEMISRVLVVMGMIASGFLSFILFTSNPFTRYLPFSPRDGSDLNPLLQDIGLIIHPPMLYLGYVGFSVAFAFAIAALLAGRLDSAWARWMRPWTLVAWMFLTLGIMLGSWWSYYELGWGGWWFWDPVENASFMPWLVGTALLHSLAATEKRGVFKSWTLLLAIFAFSLSLLGTFLVRSGVLTSVHAFASDPTRGYFILAFLAVVVGGSLTLYGIRASLLKSVAAYEPVSRESALLVNNMLLVVVMLVVLLGTLYPLVADAFHWGKISVGPPYFNQFFIPLMALLLVLLPFGVLAKWKKQQLADYRRVFTLSAVASMACAIVFSFAYEHRFNWQAFVSIDVVLWVVALTLYDLKHQLRHAASLRDGLAKLSRSYKGMVLAHLGIAITAAGICLTSLYSDARDVRMDPGQKQSLGKLDYVLNTVREEQGPNYHAYVGDVSVYRDDKLVTRLFPEKRLYNSDRGNAMTEAGITPGFLADIYVSMGEPLDKQDAAGAWAMRIHYKPFVRWIWLGALVMALGAVFAISDRRYRL